MTLSFARQVEDQSPSAPPQNHLLDRITHRLNMPVRNETLARIESLEGTTYEGAKVAAVDRVNDFSVELHGLARYSSLRDLSRRGAKRRRIWSSFCSIGSSSG